MPTIKVKSSLLASFEVNYNIATPTNASAKSIDNSLPTILFLHPVYISSPVFHSESLETFKDGKVAYSASLDQLNDPILRKFNCVTVDSRGQ